MSDGESATLAGFVCAAVLMGTNSLGVRFSNRELAPLWGAGLRFCAAAALMVALVTYLRLELPRGRAMTGALLYGTFNFALVFAFSYYGFNHVHAGLGQTLFAIIPLATLLLASAQHQARLGVTSLAGALLALCGVGVLTGASIDAGTPVLAIAALLCSAVCLAQGTVIVRAFPPVHPVTMNAVGMTLGAAVLTIASFAAGESVALPERAATWLAVGYLVAASLLMYVLILFVLRHWTAPRAAYMFVLAPFVTVGLSAWLDDEPIHLSLLVGGILVLGGVYIGALRMVAVMPEIAHGGQGEGEA